MDLKRFFEKENLKRLYASANRKRVLGFILFIIGIILFLISVHAAQKIAEANNLSTSISNAFEHNPTWNPIIKFFGGKAQEEMDYYSTVTLIIQIGGLVLTALGAVMIVIYRKKKK
jgi:hypothetical protein